MRSAEIRMFDIPAGLLVEENGYRFSYYTQWLSNPDAQAVSLSLPLTDTVYVSNTLFSFFDGLIPEGWLLEIAGKNWKLDPRDRMGLLMACCKDCIGAVSVYPLEEEK